MAVWMPFLRFHKAATGTSIHFWLLALKASEKPGGSAGGGEGQASRDSQQQPLTLSLGLPCTYEVLIGVIKSLSTTADAQSTPPTSAPMTPSVARSWPVM